MNNRHVPPVVNRLHGTHGRVETNLVVQMEYLVLGNAHGGPVVTV